MPFFFKGISTSSLPGGKYRRLAKVTWRSEKVKWRLDKVPGQIAKRQGQDEGQTRVKEEASTEFSGASIFDILMFGQVLYALS